MVPTSVALPATLLWSRREHDIVLAKDSDSYSDKEAKARFEAALKGALNTPHKPLKEKPKVEKAKKKAKTPAKK
jgi:hypothetical protein